MVSKGHPHLPGSVSFLSQHTTGGDVVIPMIGVGQSRLPDPDNLHDGDILVDENNIDERERWFGFSYPPHAEHL